MQSCRVDGMSRCSTRDSRSSTPQGLGTTLLKPTGARCYFCTSISLTLAISTAASPARSSTASSALGDSRPSAPLACRRKSPGGSWNAMRRRGRVPYSPRSNALQRGDDAEGFGRFGADAEVGGAFAESDGSILPDDEERDRKSTTSELQSLRH